jgi:acetyltransferase-like isoleucine patch superfamily enzyme
MKMFNRIRSVISRTLTRLLLWDGNYLRRKLLLQHAVHGEPERLVIGQETDLNDTLFNTMGGRIVVGDYSFFGHGCMVLTGRHDYNRRLLERKQHGDSGGDVVIGQGVWIGSGAILLGPLRIGDHAVIGAGSLVTRDCAAGGLYMGHPARWVRQIEDPEGEQGFDP